MSAGRRNRLVSIQQPLTVVTDTGSKDIVWQEFTKAFGYKRDLKTGANDKSRSSTLYPVLRVEWVIRYTVGVNPSMRLVYEGEVWDIVDVADDTFRRDNMVLLCERRGLLEEIPMGQCPSLCEQISGATAVAIVGCLDAEKLEEVQDLVCSGGPCDDGEYFNGGKGDEEVRIAVPAGQTAKASPIIVIDVDGSARDSVPNIDVVCEWKQLVGVDGQGVEIPNTELPNYPANGEIIYPDLNVIDAGVAFTNLPYRPQLLLTNAIASQATNPISPFRHEITIEVNVPVVNTNADPIGGNVQDLLTPHTIPDVPVTDDDGTVATLPAPTSIVLNGQAASAVYSGGVITITPDAPPAPSGIAYRGCVPSTSFVDSGASGLDTIPLWQAGAYDPIKPTNPAAVASLDPTDTSRSTLLNNNLFGNKLRFTDTAGNRSSVGSGVPQRIDFKNHNWAGAVNGIIIDHYIGAMYDHYNLLDGSLYSLRLDSTGQTWYQWLTAISNSTRYGYTDWIPLPVCIDTPHAYHANAGETLYSNFFSPQDSGGRCAFMTGESYSGTNFISLRDSNSPVWVDGTATNAGTTKNRENNFQAGITNVFMMRMLTPADIIALTP